MIGVLQGKIYRKPTYFMDKSRVSCRFSLKPIQWAYDLLYLSVFIDVKYNVVPQFCVLVYKPYNDIVRFAIRTQQLLELCWPG